jgi:hypothetical protein
MNLNNRSDWSSNFQRLNIYLLKKVVWRRLFVSLFLWFVGPLPPQGHGLSSHWIQLFGSFTLLEPVWHYMNWFLWWKCLDCLDWNGLFWCSECGHSRYMHEHLIYGQGHRVFDALFVTLRSLKPQHPQLCSWYRWKSVMSAMRWFWNVFTSDEKSYWELNNFDIEKFNEINTKKNI